MKQRGHIATGWYVVVDYITASLAWWLICQLRAHWMNQVGWKVDVGYSIEIFFLIPLSWLILYGLAGTYHDLYKKSRLAEMWRTAICTVIGMALLSLLILYRDPETASGYYVKVAAAAAGIHFILSFGARWLLLNRVKWQLLSGAIRFPTLLIAPAALAPRIRQQTSKALLNGGFQYIGYLSPDRPPSPGDPALLGKQANTRSLQQLRLVWQDFRALYPYRAELKLEQGRDFVRAAFTGNYFFNYANGGGLNFRFFAGKFFYTGAKTFTKQFDTDRYHLNLTGPNGYEDYTYSDYFVGRNEFDGWMSQQIMERDGGFKTRTDLLAAKVGRTDDWLMAMNFSTSIPDRLNPLSLLPVKIPLKIFADIGTYAGAWDRNANTDRFLFDAGLQLSLLKETVHIYLPLLYSQPFKEYIQSTIPKKERLLRKISFSIDLSNFQFRKINRNLGF